MDSNFLEGVKRDLNLIKLQQKIDPDLEMVNTERVKKIILR